MSSIYIQEPPTNGKVLLTTSFGEIDIELWSKEAPKACRNFVQLCMENYYNNTIFHRVIKGFIAQGGDPTGTGTGGESIYGKPFKDEFHQRLKFNRRGLVAMANAGANDNGSQFFFTLDRADELNKKHTIFGKVTGNTIYNMIRFNDIEIDEDDRPLSPPKIIKTEVLSNPFDDIEPRGLNEKDGQKEEQKGKKNKIKSKSKATKNYKLLSFGEEAEEDEEEIVSADHQIKSSHDLLNDPKLSTLPAIDVSQMVTLGNEDSKRKIDDTTENIRKKLKKEKEEHRMSEDEDEMKVKSKNERKKALQDEARKLRKELKGKKKNVKEEEEEVKEIKKEEEPVNNLMNELLSERKLFLKKKKENSLLKKGGSRESETLSLLTGFQSRLDSVTQVKDEGEDGNEDKGWMSHKLNFETSEERAKDANMKGDDWYDIYDPRNPMNQRRREKSKQNSKKR